MSLKLKNYQKKSLEALNRFFVLASSFGAKSAFEECIAENSLEAVNYNDRLEGVPSVCLRVPTGGGKTLMAAHSIPIAAEQYANTDTPIVLWLVPTDMIRTQTLSALSNPHHPYRKALQGQYGDRLKVCDIEALQTLNKHDIEGSCVIVVTTIQAFNIDKDKTYQRNAYAFDENLSEFFRNLSADQVSKLDKVTEDTLQHQPFLTTKDIGRVKHSLVNFFNIYRPIIIVDEAHKNRGGKSFFPTLKRLNPSCLVEFTATPKDNNVLYSVSAAELKAENMIKLPIVLTEHSNEDWQSCIRDSLIHRANLEVLAQKEHEYIRPILLIQAQDKNGVANVDSVKDYLLSECNIIEDWIAISTGQTKELEDINLFSESCPIRVVITVEALKEGWDCSFAYILASLQNIKSATDVEQLLGRVLRMPYAKERAQSELNKAYAHVISNDTTEATTHLKDRMIENMGFNKWEADAAIVPKAQSELGLGEAGGSATKPKEPEVSIPLPFDLKTEDLGLDLQSSVKKYETSQGSSLVIMKGTSDEVFDRIQDIALNQASPKQQESIQSSFEEARAQRQSVLAPENWNATFAPIAQLGLLLEGDWQLADKETIEDSVEWDLLDFPVSLEQFSIRETATSFEIDINTEQKSLSYKRLHTKQLHFEDMPTPITEDDLINWLDRRTRRSGLTQIQLRAYLVKLLSYLINEKKYSLTSLHRGQFQLAQAVNDEINRLFSLARKKAFQSDLFEHLKVSETTTTYNSFEFKAGIYPVRRPYRGSFKFEKHFYGQIDDLKEKTNSGKITEEFKCAQLLDFHEKVKHWVRNIPKQPHSSFWLPTQKDYFYPDFVAELIDGSIFVLEYKGGHIDTADDARIKNDIGKQWAKDSNGKRKFLMAKAQDNMGRSLEEQINQAIG